MDGSGIDVQIYLDELKQFVVGITGNGHEIQMWKDEEWCALGSGHDDGLGKGSGDGLRR
jgi:hypothetical protein